MKRSLGVLLMVTLPAWATGPHLGMATDVVITGTGIDKADEPLSQYGCESFRLSPLQVREFLNNATIVTGMEIHDVYFWSPCYVKGTAKFRGITATWKIRKFGTGYVDLAGEYVFSIVDEKRAPRIEHKNL